MKIRNLKIINNKILGDLDLNFCDNDGKVLDTIILAGENGSGKTTILNIIYNLSSEFFSLDKEEKWVFELELTSEELRGIEVRYCLSEIKKYNEFGGSGMLSPVKMTFSNVDDSDPREGNNSWKGVSLDFYEEGGLVRNFNNLSFLFGMDSFISTQAVIFFDNDYSSPPADIALYHGRKKSNYAPWDFSKNILDNIVKINQQDLEDIAEWTRAHIGEAISEEKIDSGIKKLKEVFKILMPKKQLSVVKNNEIIFTEGKNTININQLSSGELEVILSATYLILETKNRQESFSTLLIDEPEAKLHPEWQSNILNLYKAILSNEEGGQDSQIFIATHSPFIIHKRHLNDKVIVLAKDPDGKVTIPTESSFPGVTSNQLIESAFDITDFVKSDQPCIFVEGKTDKHYLLKALELFEEKNFTTSIKIASISREGRGGKGDMKRCYDTFKSKQELLKNKIILLYDPEEDIKEEDENLLCVLKMDFNENSNIKCGIENLFSQEAIQAAKEKGFIDENEKGIYIRDDKKMEMCNWICNEIVDINIQKEYLFNFQQLILKIKGSLA